jgi:hypothetical protein
MKKRITESQIDRLVRIILEEDDNNRDLRRLKEKLEDAYMIRDWHYIAEIIADLKFKLRKK